MGLHTDIDLSEAEATILAMLILLLMVVDGDATVAFDAVIVDVLFATVVLISFDLIFIFSN